ncbi:MAG: MMPL family transporter [Phycisphaerae bacterium]|nr:MMPL family transporter [Phycisphaerae bacterium]
MAIWIAACVGLFVFVPHGDPSASEHRSFLPDDTPSRVATTKLAKLFPDSCGLSQATVIFERSSGALTKSDEKYINKIAGKIKRPNPNHPRPGKEELEQLTVVSPGMLDIAHRFAQTRASAQAILKGKAAPVKGKFHNPLKSKIDANGQAAIIRVNIPADYITSRSGRVIKHIRRLVAENSPPTGLTAAITGSGGYGHDYAEFVRRGHTRTMYATLIAVIVILLIVYRAPLASVIPLIAVSIAAAIVVKIMNILQNMGFSIGMAEQIFVFVLMYGAGVDYSLLLISRYREFLACGESHRGAMSRALDATFPAITASAATDSIGMLMLVFCSFLIFKTTGPIVAMSLVVALLAAVTLVPAMIGIFGPRIFWPTRIVTHHTKAGKFSLQHVWPFIARKVTKRPAIVLVATLVLLLIPASQVPKITWVYDALAGIDEENIQNVGNAASGLGVAKRHWPIGETGPVSVLIQQDKGHTKLTKKQWNELSRTITRRVGDLDGVQNVRSLTQPIGNDVTATNNTAMAKLLDNFGKNPFYKGGFRCIRVEVLLGTHTMSNAAMDTVKQIREISESVLKNAGLEKTVHVYIGGSTAQMMDIKTVTQSDFRRVIVLVLGVIFIIVMILLRDIFLTIFIIGAIILSYLATLGISAWVFINFLGMEGLDWKVEMFLFVVMAAVGVDYSIFLASRLAQEARNCEPREAVRRAVAFTGPVISSCGLIMAATLGSLMAGRIELLRELGFALGLGMLVDTFIVRPLLLPSFAALFKRTGKKSKLIG